MCEGKREEEADIIKAKKEQVEYKIIKKDTV